MSQPDRSGEETILHYAFGDAEEEPGGAADPAALARALAEKPDLLSYATGLLEDVLVAAGGREAEAARRLDALLDDVMILLGHDADVPATSR